MSQRSPPVVHRMLAAAAQMLLWKVLTIAGLRQIDHDARTLFLARRNCCPAYRCRSIQPILRRAPGDTVALKVALEVPVRYFVTLDPLLHHPDRGKLNDRLPQGSAGPRARAAAEFTVNNQEAEREHTLCPLPGSQ